MEEDALKLLARIANALENLVTALERVQSHLAAREERPAPKPRRPRRETPR